MRGFLIGLSVSVAFIVGCAASRFVPPANAQSAGPRWDYFCFAGYDAEGVMEKARAAGSQGWELSGVGAANRGSTWCFKRPMR